MGTPRGQLSDKRQRLCELLLDDIRSGRQPAGSRLPSEWELVGRYGVSRTTVRSALAQLDLDGLVQRRKGCGTWVHPDAGRRLDAARPPTRRIAVVLCADKMNNPIYSGILAAFHDALPAGCQAVVHHHHAVKPALYADVQAAVVDGGFDDADIARVQERVRRVAVLNRRHPRLPSVCTDNRLGGMLMIRHALERGHRRIGVVHFGDEHAGGRSVEEFTLRLQGIRAACAEAGVAPVEVRLELHRMFEFGPAEAVDRLLAAAPAVSVILAVADTLAVMLMECLAERAVPVPRRMGIIGFDDLALSRFTSPALTTVRQPVEEMGRALADCAAALADGRPAGSGDPLRPHLVVRESCPAFRAQDSR